MSARACTSSRVKRRVCIEAVAEIVAEGGLAEGKIEFDASRFGLHAELADAQNVDPATTRITLIGTKREMKTRRTMAVSRAAMVDHRAPGDSPGRLG